jgi:O-antigen ligase/tetratricopeptide (TPR) repeat protein
MKGEKIVKAKPSNLMTLAFLLFGGLVYLYYPKIQNYSATPKWIFVAVFSLIILFFGKNVKIPWSAALTTWFLFVILYLIQSYWSYNFWDAVVRTIPLILAPLSVVLLYREASDLKEFYSKTSVVLAVLITPILLITLVEILGLISTGEYSHLSTYAFRFSFGNRNQYSELLVLLVPLLAVRLVYAKEKAKRIFLVSIIFLIYLTVTLLLNRASILVLYGVYPVFFLFFLLQKAKLKTRKLAYGVILLSVLCGTIIVSSPLRKKIPVVRNLLETRYGSGNERLQIWGNSIDLWKASPIFGKGSGDWKIEILKTPLGFTKAEESTVFYQRAHNDFIQIAVENGLIGLVLFVAFFVLGFVLLFKSDIDFRIKILLSSGITGYILLSNFSFPIEKIELLILLFLFLAPGLSQRISSRKKLNVEKMSGSVITLAMLVLSFSWLKNERNYFEFKSDGDQLAFSEINQDFYTIDPTTTPIYWHEGNAFYNQQDYENALTAYRKALKHNPNHAHVLNNLGSCHYGLGEMDEAEKYYRRALAINPNFIESLMNYSSFLFNKGDIDGALNHILLIPNNKEPTNYPVYIHAIAKAKYKWMMELHDDPTFEKFLIQTYDDDAFLYEISKKARISGESYEIALRTYLATNSSN